jgi:hypothetical protein
VHRVSYLEGMGLEEFQRELLSENDIPDGEQSFRPEAQYGEASSARVEFFDIELNTALDAVGRASVTAAHVKEIAL